MPKKQVVIILVATFGLLLTYQNCSNVDFGALASDPSQGGQGNPVQPPPPQEPPPVPIPVLDGRREFQQPALETFKKIDLLFVTDTSGSLDEERGEVADNIDQFVSGLAADVDIQIAVLLAHGSKSSLSGRLYQKDEEPLVLRPALDSEGKRDLSQLKQDLSDKLRSPKSDGGSDGGEEGLYSLSRLVDGNRLIEARAAGFFRSDAALAVVFIADENDICARYPQGVTPVVDGDGSEGPAFVRDCVSPAVTSDSVYLQLRSLQGERPLLVGGVIYTGENPVPKSGENEIGYGLIEMIAVNKGLPVDLAGNNIAGGLAAIGNLASEKLIQLTEFSLIQGDVKRPDQILADSIKVMVDGQEVPHSYQPTVGTVILSRANAGGPLARIEISFRYRAR